MKRVCQVILLFIFASIYIYPDDYLHPIFFIDGKLLDYKWAHNSNNLAILLRKYSEENWLDYIYIINAETAEIEKKYCLTDLYKSHLHFECFDWLSDDSGFLLAADCQEYSYVTNCFYIFDIENEYYELFYDYDGCIQIREIAIDYNSDYWAFIYTREGDPFIEIYEKNYCMLYGDGYFNLISILRWKNRDLYIYTDSAYEFSLNPIEIEDNNIIDNKAYVYIFDPDSNIILISRLASHY